MVLIDDARYRLIHALPHVGEADRRFLLRAPCFCGLRTFDEAQHLAHRERFRRARQQVAAFGAAPRFDEAALLQAGQDQLQKFLRDLLPPRDVGDLDRLARLLQRQIEDRLQRVFTFHGDVQCLANALRPPEKVEERR